MTGGKQVWGRRKGRNPFSLGRSKPRRRQIISLVGHCTVIFGGPLLGLVMIKYYPFLIQSSSLYIGGLASIVFGFLASFAFFHGSDFPRGTPGLARFLFRAGWGLGMAGLLLGLVGIGNGYGTPLVSREAAVVSKHPTRHRDPSRRIYYLAIRAWPGSHTVVELGAPRAVYDGLKVPITAIDTPQPVLEAMQDAGQVRITLGEGRFGLEWLKLIDLP